MSIFIANLRKNILWKSSLRRKKDVARHLQIIRESVFCGKLRVNHFCRSSRKWGIKIQCFNLQLRSFRQWGVEKVTSLIYLQNPNELNKLTSCISFASILQELLQNFKNYITLKFAKFCHDISHQT